MKISICTTTARRGFVEYQARMLANQTYKDIEWVLVDFAFEERSKLMYDLGRELNLKIVHLPNYRGKPLFFRDITRNRNRALKHATGAAVIFLDDYAVISPDFVEQHHRVLVDNNISAGIMHRLEHPTDDDVLAAIKGNRDLRSDFPNNIGKDHRDRGHTYITKGGTYTGNLGIPRFIFEDLNGFDPRMESGLEDCDFGDRASFRNFSTFINQEAYTINLDTGNAPYTYQFDHAHDVEPFISNPNNNYWGDATLKENDFMTVEFHGVYRTAICKICGARGMIDPNEIMAAKRATNDYRTPEGLVGGYK